jgi:hypothetical protein
MEHNKNDIHSIEIPKTPTPRLQSQVTRELTLALRDGLEQDASTNRTKKILPATLHLIL